MSRLTPPALAAKSFLDVAVTASDKPPDGATRDEPAYEIWTANRVYTLTSLLRCVEVTDLRTGTSSTDDVLVGATLVGGEKRDGERWVMVTPFPVPGSRALFQREPREPGANVYRSSAVLRLTLRIHATVVEHPISPDTLTRLSPAPSAEAWGGPRVGNALRGDPCSFGLECGELQAIQFPA